MVAVAATETAEVVAVVALVEVVASTVGSDVSLLILVLVVERSVPLKGVTRVGTICATSGVCRNRPVGSRADTVTTLYSVSLGIRIIYPFSSLFKGDYTESALLMSSSCKNLILV